MTKVAHLTTVDLSLRYLLFDQLEALRDAGCEVIGISAPGPHVADLQRAGIRHVALPSSTRAMDPRADARAVRELWRILRRERPDVLHTHTPKPSVYGRIVGRLAGVPIVVNTVHGLYATPDDSVSKRGAVYGLEALASRFADANLVLNEEDLALMRRWHLSPRDRTRLLRTGVDLTRFDRARFDPADRAGVRRELGVTDHEVVVGAVGRLVAEKGYAELFEAAIALGPEFVVVVVGADDPQKADAITRADRARAEAAGVRFLGHRDDVDRLYAAFDVLAIPSYREGVPQVAMEAAAMGLPIIASDIRGCRQVVEDGVTGVLVPVRDAAALTAAIRRLGDNERVRGEMSDAAALRARRLFDESAAIAGVINAYDEVATRKGRPPIAPRPGATS